MSCRDGSSLTSSLSCSCCSTDSFGRLRTRPSQFPCSCCNCTPSRSITGTLPELLICWPPRLFTAWRWFWCCRGRRKRPAGTGETPQNCCTSPLPCPHRWAQAGSCPFFPDWRHAWTFQVLQNSSARCISSNCQFVELHSARFHWFSVYIAPYWRRSAPWSHSTTLRWFFRSGRFGW